MPPDGRDAKTFAQTADVEADLKAAPSDLEAIDLYCMTLPNTQLLTRFKNLKRLEIGGPDDYLKASDIKALSALPIESLYIRADHTGVGMPAAISQLKHLKYLAFAGGWEPIAFADLARNKRMEGLHVFGNLVGDLSQLRRCPNLKVLTFLPRSEQDINDLYKLPQLDELCVAGSTLPAASLANLGRLTSLKNVDVSSTKLGDEELASLSGSNVLECLNLSKTAVSDAGLSELGRMKTLRALSLQDCSVTDAGVDLLGTKTNGACLAQLKECRNLRNLRLGAVLNADLAAVSGLPSIEYLNLQAATLNEAGAQSVAKMPRLRTLVIGRVTSPEVYKIVKGSASLKNVRSPYILQEELAANMAPVYVFDTAQAEPRAFSLLIHNTHDIRDWTCF